MIQELIARARSLWRGVRRGASLGAEMDEEFRHHIELRTEDLVRGGWAPEEAARKARLEFGYVERYKQEGRESRGLRYFDELRFSWLDVKLGLRMLVRYPGLTLVGGLGIAVAIAIGTGFFTFLHSHLYPRIPLPEGDRIVALENWDVEVNDEERQAIHDLASWRAEMKTVQDIAAFRDIDRNLMAGDAPPELVPVAEMTAAGFRVARVPPLMGRYLVEEDERPGAPPVAVIGHAVWQNRFQGDRNVVGKELRLGNTPHTIVGVMPEGFAFPRDHHLWTPLKADPAKYERGTGPEIFIFGRLAPGRTLDDAQAELSAIGRRSAAAFPKTHAQLRPQALPYTRPLLDIQDPGEFFILQGMMSLLLVVVALNVAVLVYARTAMRRGEIAVRSALGASRRRIVAQLFAEALVLAAGAAVFGLALAQLGLRWGNAIMEAEVGTPFWTDSGLRGATVLYTIGLTVIAAMIVGVLPALQSTGRQLQADLRQLGGGTGMRLGKTWTVLIVAQVAAAVAALPGAVDIGYGTVLNAATKPIYPAERFVRAGLGLLDTEPPAGADTVAHHRELAARFGDRLTELMRRLEAEPGVAGVTFASGLPGRGGMVRVEVEAPDASGAGPADPGRAPDAVAERAVPESEGLPAAAVSSSGVALNYFDVFGVRLLAGRPFAASDLGEDPAAVIVDRTFVRKVLRGGNALGRRIRYVAAADDEREGEALPKRWYEIVGVVEDLHVNALDPEQIPATVYYPLAPGHVRGGGLTVRLRGPVSPAFSVRLREITTALDPTLRLGMVRSLADADRQEKLAARLFGLAVGLVMLSVFLLSAAGVYALMSFTVTQRRREIGIRTALGAPPRQVLRSICSRAAGQIGLGVVVGVAAAVLLEWSSGGELMGGRGAVLLPIVALAMTVVGLLAALGPARRGLRIQPTEALRAEL